MGCGRGGFHGSGEVWRPVEHPGEGASTADDQGRQEFSPGDHPTRPGRPRREDYEYLRAGTRNLSLTCEPRAGWRHVALTKRRTMQDFAHQMRWLVDEAYPDVPVIRLVLDNLNTHRMASLYETFSAAEAQRIAKRMEFHHTPRACLREVECLSASAWIRLTNHAEALSG